MPVQVVSVTIIMLHSSFGIQRLFLGGRASVLLEFRLVVVFGRRSTDGGPGAVFLVNLVYTLTRLGGENIQCQWARLSRPMKISEGQASKRSHEQCLESWAYPSACSGRVQPVKAR